MEPSIASPGKRRNLGFFKPKLYIQERRRTDTIIPNTAPADDEERCGTLRRTQSDRTEYSHKLKAKMTPHAIPEAPVTPNLDPEEQRQHMMGRRLKVIKELVETEKDHFNDLDLCITQVVQPLREKKVECLDVDGLFSNIESVHQISAKLLSMLEYAIAEDEPEMQMIGEIFLQLKTPLEEVYKIYCYHHNDANSLLETYDKDDEIQQHIRNQVDALKGKSTLLDMGSLLIKPVQRVMKYPLLLSELFKSTPELHADHKPVGEALAAVRQINVNINEFKRRKDLVMKYKKSDEDESLRDKLSKVNIRSIRKKSNRVTSHLKILTWGELQVKDETFDREEKIFRNLEKAVRLCAKNTSCYHQNIQEGMLLAVQNVHSLQRILQDSNNSNCDSVQDLKTYQQSFESFKDRLERLIVVPLAALHILFSTPQKLIQKRYDKLLDYVSCLKQSESVRDKRAAEELNEAKKDYEALNGQLVEELQKFNKAAKEILINCIYCFMAVFRDLMSSALQASPSGKTILISPSDSVRDRKKQAIEEIHSLSFGKEFGSQRVIERRSSLEERSKKRTSAPLPQAPQQTEDDRAKLLATHSPDKLFQAKRKFNAAQDLDASLHEGEIVAVLEKQDPLGSVNRWLIDTGVMQGYVYSSFLRPYNPAAGQSGVSTDGSVLDEDFDDISLFVSSPCGDTNNARNLHFNASDGGDPLNDSQEVSTPETSTVNGNDDTSSDLEDQQIFYAVYPFEARSKYELSLQEYERVTIVKPSDLSGNPDWWLAEVKGKRGYVPANYLGRMTYA
ncbi:rho guanine nucleotide exchange factor 38 isoform X2 [Stegostoma tigrinum]|uniref:rho guanine nucleotide exchange factor 38 isoform X2 n=1 Tax=Stegostoma tigrinum TaxID=3053191 RepID=UPI00202B574E|nr:rho guanine nucleotide exchange factor 38 isoform X2 [Stegostoma tigrinum]